jgi:hypothetical protein
LSATILAAVFLAFSGGFLELEFPAYVFRRLQTAANISVQIYFPPKISGGFETAANPSVQIFISRFVSRKIYQNRRKCIFLLFNFWIRFRRNFPPQMAKNRRKWFRGLLAAANFGRYEGKFL